MEEKRQAALAEANGMTKEELAKMKSSSSKSKGPAKPPRQARKPGKQQVRVVYGVRVVGGGWWVVRSSNPRERQAHADGRW